MSAGFSSMDGRDSGLDFCSSDFNPRRALTSASTRPPVPEARPLDNILKCRIYLHDSHPLALPLDARKASQRRPLLANKVQSSREESRHIREDTIAAMMRYLDDQGPFTWLSRKARQGDRVRVVTKHRKGGIRGEAIGKLVAFDKHMNLVLRDVEEKYTVRVFKDRQNMHGSSIQRPILEKRKRSMPNVLLTGRSVVLLSEITHCRDK